MFILLLLTMTFSCKSSIQDKIESAGFANTEFISLIKNNKLVFLSENHTEVSPILFLTNNLHELYQAGLRYLIFEGVTPPDEQKDRIFYFYPWSRTGWKIEGQLLRSKIIEINSTQDASDQIHIIYGEDGFIYPQEVNFSNMEDYFKKRDEYIYKRICEIEDNSTSDEKILIFYGSSHGSKIKYSDFTPDGISKFDWTPFSSFLSDSYGSNFVSVDYRRLYGYIPDGLVEIQSNPKIIDRKDFINTDYASDDDYYDYYIFDEYPRFGINYQYDLSKANIMHMINTLKKINNRGIKESSDSDYYRANDRGQFFLILYYFKLYFGDNFDFTLWNCNNNLSEELDKLESILTVDNASLDNSFQIPQYDMTTLRSFHGKMSLSMPIPYKIREKDYISHLRNNMLQTIEIFPEDLWSYYWLAYSYFLSKDYLNAKKYYDYLLSKDLVNSMEILPLLLKQQIICCEKIGLLNDLNENKKLFKNLETQYSDILGNCFDLAIIAQE